LYGLSIYESHVDGVVYCSRVNDSFRTRKQKKRLLSEQQLWFNSIEVKRLYFYGIFLKGAFRIHNDHLCYLRRARCFRIISRRDNIVFNNALFYAERVIFLAISYPARSLSATRLSALNETFTTVDNSKREIFLTWLVPRAVGAMWLAFRVKLDSPPERIAASQSDTRDIKREGCTRSAFQD